MRTLVYILERYIGYWEPVARTYTQDGIQARMKEFQNTDAEIAIESGVNLVYAYRVITKYENHPKKWVAEAIAHEIK